jgi:acyl-coenzyme A synthetase/AMP-(fatty) acid ligase
VAEYGVKTMFTAPTALRAIRRVDPDLEELPAGALDSLETLFLAGERLDPETWQWANDGLGVPIVDHWWQTETGWPICAVPVGLHRLETRAGSTAVPVIGVHDPLKGQRAAGFVTLKAHEHIDHDSLEAELVALVRAHIGPVAAFRGVMILDRLPKTRSGKILRKTMRQIVDGEPYRIPATIEDPSVLDALVELVARPVAARKAG